MVTLVCLSCFSTSCSTDVACEERIVSNPDLAYNVPMHFQIFAKSIKTKEDVLLCDLKKWIDISTPGGPSEFII